MASSYSTNLKLELIGTGDQDGTWGDTVNTNLGTLIEQAIVGYGNPEFTGDANETISISNGATSAARCVYLNVTSTGTLTATRDLIVPTINKPYYVYNNTTGGQSIRVKTSAGTGVTIPTGKRALVFVDSTNVVSAVDWMASLALTTALPITSGGTGLSAAGTSGYIPVSNGSAWAMTAPTSISVFASGTRMIFQQTAAPTGWTKDTTATYNDSAMRIVTGAASTGGSTAFTTVFGASVNTGSYTLTTTDIPSHTHGVSITTGNPSADHTHTITTSGASVDHTHSVSITSGGRSAAHTHSGTTSSDGSHSHGVGTSSVTGDTGGIGQANPSATSSGTTDAAGSHSHTMTTGTESADHTHLVSGTSGGRSADHTHSGTTAGVSAWHTHLVSGTSAATGGAGGHAHTMSMNIKYTDCIIATKD